MSEDLSDALQEINGVGPATAENILDVLGEHGQGPDDELRELLEDAVDYHEAGEHSYAAKYARRALEQLDGSA